MYTTFFGLKENPFNLTPDPRYLFLSRCHREALSHLRYGINERKGFIVITGDIGTGKTTLIRALLADLDPTVKSALIFNAYISEKEILHTINQEFGISSDHTLSPKECIDELNEFLLNNYRSGGNAVLFLDEAQNLTPKVLEQIRMLSNLETEQDKLLQIIFVGQNEFNELLAMPGLKQLNDRITVRYHLDSLDRKDSIAYINHRLTVAGAKGAVRITRPAQSALFNHSHGNPRLINAIADRALLIAYTKDQFKIKLSTMKKASYNVQGMSLYYKWRIYGFPRRKKLSFIVPFLIILSFGAGLFLKDPIMAFSTKAVSKISLMLSWRMDSNIHNAMPASSGISEKQPQLTHENPINQSNMQAKIDEHNVIQPRDEAASKTILSHEQINTNEAQFKNDDSQTIKPAIEKNESNQSSNIDRQTQQTYQGKEKKNVSDQFNESLAKSNESQNIIDDNPNADNKHADLSDELLPLNLSNEQFVLSHSTKTQEGEDFSETNITEIDQDQNDLSQSEKLSTDHTQASETKGLSLSTQLMSQSASNSNQLTQQTDSGLLNEKPIQKAINISPASQESEKTINKPTVQTELSKQDSIKSSMTLNDAPNNENARKEKLLNQAVTPINKENSGVEKLSNQPVTDEPHKKNDRIEKTTNQSVTKLHPKEKTVVVQAEPKSENEKQNEEQNENKQMNNVATSMLTMDKEIPKDLSYKPIDENAYMESLAFFLGEPWEVGMSAPEIMWVQKTLNDSGYTVKITGVYNKETMNAIKRLQKDFGLKVDGIIGPQSKWALYQLSTSKIKNFKQF